MGAHVIESTGAEVPSRRVHRDPHNQQEYSISARSRTPRSFRTAIRADVGESQAYKHALLRGEIGLQRPMGANVRGVDFITAIRREAAEIQEIVCNDVKSSAKGKFPAAKQYVPGTWRDEVRAAIGRLQLRITTTDVAGPPLHRFPLPVTADELTVLQRAIEQAFEQNRLRLRQLNVDYSESGQGHVTGW